MATIKADTKKTADTVQVHADAKVSLKEVRKPLYASVGAGDFAVEKLRELPTRYTGGVKRFQAQVKELPAQVKELPVQVKELPAQVKELPAHVKELPAAVKAQLSELSEKATHLYEEFAERGENVVTSIRKSPSTEAAIEEGKTAVRQVKAVRTSTRRAAEAAEKAVENAASKIG